MNDFTIETLQRHPKRKHGLARKKVKGVSFKKRQQARQWCRNHWYEMMHEGIEIVHPDGTKEPFKWDSAL